jgi:hypothetical protein
MPGRGRGGASVMASINRPEPTALHSIVSGSSSAPTGPQPRGQPRPAHYSHRLHRHTGFAPRVTAAGSS